MKRFLFWFVLLLAVRAFAITPAPYLQAVSFSAKVTGTNSGTLTIYSESTATLAVSAAVSESDVTTAKLRPGRRYPINFSGNGISATG